MNMKSDIHTLIELAHENLDEAKLLWQVGKKHRAAISRAYYAMFHAAQAALESQNLEASSHHGQISLFGEHFIKTGIFPKNMSRLLSHYFSLRQDADYKPYVSISDQMAELALKESEDFVAAIEEWLHLNQFL